MEATAVEGERRGEWFESIDLMLSSLVVEGTKKDEGQKGPFRYSRAHKLTSRPLILKWDDELFFAGLEFPDLGLIKLDPEFWNLEWIV